MCGIVGQIARGSISCHKESVHNALHSIAYRGPDHSDTYITDKVALGHNRLKIIDLSEGANQPFCAGDGEPVLIFNGEIFNYKELKKEIQASFAHISFQTESDTEVLYYMLKYWGKTAITKLNGFWAFAFYNPDEQNILFSRDRLGVKPFFYSVDQNFFYFASEPKALFALGAEKSIAEEHLDEHLFYRYVSGENTLFKDVFRLLPGHNLIYHIAESKFEIERYFNLSEEAKKTKVFGNKRKWLRSAFESAIKRRMIADVPIGTLLSGGLDSSIVAFKQAKLGFKSLSTWNIGFNDSKHDESKIAERFSKNVGFDFHTINPTKEDIFKSFQKMLQVMDEPSCHFQEAHLLQLFNQIKTKNTVVLSGEGADELFGGYYRYKIFGSQIRWYVYTALAKILSYLNIKNYRSDKLQAYLDIKNQPFQLLENANNIFLSDLAKLNIHGINLLPKYRIQILEEAEKYYPKSRLRQLMYLDMHLYIPSLNERNDRTSMAYQVECREPFQDIELVKSVWSLPNRYFGVSGKGKKLLFNSYKDVLPKYITKHRKVGLSIPWREILLTSPEFKQLLDDMPNSALWKKGELWQLDIDQLLVDFKRAPSRMDSFLIQLFFLWAWYEKQFK
jgi:asparagine synthase (glutamine-hydrolysing)